MNDHAQAWVEALRSGEYDQTDGVLRDDQGYCCLGVACELYREAHPDTSTWVVNKGFQTDADAYPNPSLLPLTVREWLGLSDDRGAFIDAVDERGTLIGLNDNGATFDEIADVIASEPEGLFVDA